MYCLEIIWNRRNVLIELSIKATFRSSTYSLSRISSTLSDRDNERLVEQLHTYWKLKRSSRQGIPLVQKFYQMLLTKRRLSKVCVVLDIFIIIRTLNISIAFGRHSMVAASFELILFWIVKHLKQWFKKYDIIIKCLLKTSPQKSMVVTTSHASSNLMDRVRYDWLKKWRRSYEKVRLLLELVRKREKMKLEMVRLLIIEICCLFTLLIFQPSFLLF